MTIRQQRPQLLPLLYETIRKTTTTAATTFTQTTKATIFNNYNDTNNNSTASTYELVHMSKNLTNKLPQTAFLYSASSSSSSLSSSLETSALSSSALSSSTSLVANIVESLTSLENITNTISNSIEAYSAAAALATPPVALSGNYTWDSIAATSTTIITSTSTSYTTTTFTVSDDNATTATATTTTTATATLTPSVDSYFVGMPWSKALVVAIFIFLILVTVVGNTLVILSVLTTRRLRTVTNCFVLNLAITDWLVGTCVMPPNVILYIVGSWQFGWILCDIWISLDVLLCTASILSLCAISLDRYLAVTQPLTYSKNRRTKRLALFMIFIVWVTALSITCPPYLGWYEPGRRKEGNTVCRYNQNKGYVVFSAMGSFFIPLAVMLYVYLKIGYVLTSRRQRIVRDANSERTADHDIDCDNFLSESEHFQCGPQKFPSFKSRWTIDGGSASNSKTNSLKCSKCNKNYVDQHNLKHQASFYELVEISRLSTQIAATHPPQTCTSINCKYGDGTCTPTGTGTSISYTIADGGSRAGVAGTLAMQQLHCTDSRSSFSETCLAQAMAQIGKYNGNGQQQQQQTNTLSNNQQTHQHHHHHNNHHHRVPMRVSTTKRDSKTAKTLTMVMGGFIACWLPFFVYYLLIPFLPKAAVFEGLMSFLTWVGWVNCAINPFIYAFYNPDFRTAFWRLTCKRICKQKSPANHMTMFRG